MGCGVTFIKKLKVGDIVFHLGHKWIVKDIDDWPTVWIRCLEKNIRGWDLDRDYTNYADTMKLIKSNHLPEWW